MNQPRGRARWAAALLAAGFAIGPGPAAARAGEGVLFVVPARYSVLQVMMDVLERRDAVLVSYQGGPADPEPLLHAWSGREWVYVAFDDFRTAHFLRVRPRRVVFVGDSAVLPEILVSGASAWAPVAMNVEGMDPASLVNAAGRLLSFREDDWRWFAGRYRMSLSDEAAPERAQSWYDEPYLEAEPPESPWRRFRRRFAPSGPRPPAPPAVAPPAPPAPPAVAPPPPPAPLPPAPVIGIEELPDPAEEGIK